MKKYSNDYEGKKELVDEIIKPLLLSINMGWTDVQYDYEPSSHEVVICTNANTDKTQEINVYADSLRAMTADIMRGVFNLDYKRWEA